MSAAEWYVISMSDDIFFDEDAAYLKLEELIFFNREKEKKTLKEMVSGKSTSVAMARWQFYRMIEVLDTQRAENITLRAANAHLRRKLEAQDESVNPLLQALDQIKAEHRVLIPCPDGRPGCAVAHYKLDFVGQWIAGLLKQYYDSRK